MEGGGARSDTKSRRVIKTPSWILGFRPSSRQAAGLRRLDVRLHNARSYWFRTQMAFIIQARFYVPTFLFFFFFFF